MNGKRNGGSRRESLEISASEVATLFHVCVRTVMNRAHKGLLPKPITNHPVLFLRAAIMAQMVRDGGGTRRQRWLADRAAKRAMARWKGRKR